LVFKNNMASKSCEDLGNSFILMPMWDEISELYDSMDRKKKPMV
jgi:hypothetical protein